MKYVCIVLCERNLRYNFNEDRILPYVDKGSMSYENTGLRIALDRVVTSCHVPTNTARESQLGTNNVITSFQSKLVKFLLLLR